MISRIYHRPGVVVSCAQAADIFISDYSLPSGGFPALRRWGAQRWGAQRAEAGSRPPGGDCGYVDQAGEGFFKEASQAFIQDINARL